MGTPEKCIIILHYTHRNHNANTYTQETYKLYTERERETDGPRLMDGWMDYLLGNNFHTGVQTMIF
jgi:hypothetical protein